MSAKFQKVRNGVSLRPQTADPSDGENGDIYYNSALNKFRRYENGVWKNLGSGTGVGDVDILSADLAEDANLADYTQTGLEILVNVGAGEVHGDTAFRLIHQAASTRSFKKTIAVDRNWRGKNNTLQFSVRSSAASANLTVLVRDETNSADLLASTQVTTGRVQFSATTSSGLATLSNVSVADYNSVRVGDTITGAGIPTGTKILSKTLSGLVITLSANATASATVTLSASALPAKQTFTFDVPDNCASLSWTISALQEANLPETYIDDVIVKLTSTAKTNASYSQTTFNTTEPVNYTPTTSGIGGPSNVDFSWERIGHMMRIKGSLTAGASPSGAVSISLPPGYTIDTTSPTGIKKIVGGGAQVGFLYNETSSGTAQNYYVGGYTAMAFYDGSDTSNIYFSLQTQSGVFVKSTWNSFATPSEGGSFVIEVPIAGWTNATTTSQTVDLTSSVLVTQPDSAIDLNNTTTAVLGSTYTRIPRYANLVSSRGSDIRYIDSATDGASFTALTDGIYDIEVSSQVTTASSWAFTVITKNLNLATKGSTNADALTPADGVLAFAFPPTVGAAGGEGHVTWTGWLNAGDVIRSHVGANGSASGYFRMVKRNSMKILNPSSDQKIEIPSSELRFEGASARGSTDTAIVKFDTQTLTRGDGFSVINTAANGTVITILKDGKLDVGASVYLNHTNSELVISRNQTTLTAVPTAGSQYLAGEFSAIAQIYNVKWSGAVYKNDVIRIASSTTGGIASYAGNSLCLSLQEQKVAVALSNVVPQFQDGDGYLELNTYNGVGSTRTRIMRFSNLTQQDGLGKFTYTDSATDGASITVNEDGVYNIICGWGSANNSAIGLALTKNEVLSSTGSTDGTALSRAQGLIASSYIGAISTALTLPIVSYSGKLNKGDVIRCHTDANTTNPNPSLTYFNISKVGKPSISAVDVTPFVNLKAQDYELIQSAFTPVSTYGSTNTGVALFTLTKNTNKGIIRVDSSATAGHSFTALKDCRVTVAASAGGNSTGIPGVYITKNETVLTAAALTPSAVMAYCAIAANNNSAYAVSTFEVIAGDVIRIQRDSTNLQGVSAMSLFAVADSTSIVSAAKSYRMSDYLATGTRVTGTAPTALGQYRSYLRTGGGTTFTETNGAPTNAPSLTNGIYLSRGSSFAGTDPNNDPTRYEIFIGKNKNFEVVGYASAGRTGQADLTPTLVGTAESSGYVTSYDPTSGVLTLTRFIPSNAITNSGQAALTSTGAGSGAIAYCDINVFESPYVSIPSTAPTIQKFTSGSGTYVKPAGVKYIKVKMVGGGGGGGGGGTAGSPGTGGAGGNTTFGSLTANGGSGGVGAGLGGAGGTASLGAGAVGSAFTGGQGGYGHTWNLSGTNNRVSAGAGAGTPFASFTPGDNAQQATIPTAVPNSGAGGGGGRGQDAAVGGVGGGGGAGGFIDATISPAASTYSYSIGTGGSGGSAGTSAGAGGAGAAGYIVVEEYYV